MIRTRLLGAAAFLAAGVLAWSGVARAGDEVPTAAPAAAAEAPKTAETPKTTPETKTPSPVISVLGWIGKQIAPDLACPCPATEAGEKAYRAWFAGGKDVPLADLRDRLVADGWNADRLVAHFKAARAKACADGGCDKSKCGDGACDKSKCGDGGCCKGKTGDATAAASTENAKADGGCCKGSGERADGKPCCGGCKDKAKTPDAAKPEEAPAPAKP
jgi:hypothetical protein